MIKKVPFSGLFLLIILAISAVSGTLFREINPDIIKTFGFSVYNLFSIKFYTAITMVFLVSSPIMLLGILIIIVGCFAYEYLYGTKKAVLMFISTHLTGLLGLYLLALANFPSARELDVGASVGFWGMSGAVVGKFRYKEVFFIGLVLFLFVAFIIKGSDVSNIEHPISFVAGILFQKIINYYERSKR